MDIDNHYKTLSVPENASNDELLQAHKKLTMQYHPEHNPNNEEAEHAFMQVQIAFLNLFDPAMRKEHDTALRNSRTLKSMGDPQQASKEDATQKNHPSHPIDLTDQWGQAPSHNQLVYKRPLRSKKATLFGFVVVLMVLVFLVLINLYKLAARLL